MNKIVLAIVIACLALGVGLYVSYAGKDVSEATANETTVQETAEAAQPEPEQKEEVKVQKNPVAVIEMEKGGIIEFELFVKDAPISAENLIKLANKKYYDGLVFHRVVPGFVAQTGCPEGTGMGGPGYTIKDEASPRKHIKGAVGMAKTTAPDSAGSQFYFCLESAHPLDGNYTVFGQTIKGMDVVSKIKVGDKMKKMTIRMPEEPKAEEPKAEEAKAETAN